jgi:hypothetical protein
MLIIRIQRNRVIIRNATTKVAGSSSDVATGFGRHSGRLSQKSLREADHLRHPDADRLAAAQGHGMA